jgi:hypothetical protein
VGGLGLSPRRGEASLGERKSQLRSPDAYFGQGHREYTTAYTFSTRAITDYTFAKRQHLVSLRLHHPNIDLTILSKVAVLHVVRLALS